MEKLPVEFKRAFLLKLLPLNTDYTPNIHICMMYDKKAKYADFVGAEKVNRRDPPTITGYITVVAGDLVIGLDSSLIQGEVILEKGSNVGRRKQYKGKFSNGTEVSLILIEDVDI